MMIKSIYSSNTAPLSPVPHHSKSSGSANSDQTREREKAMAEGHILGVDFGTSKIGLAIADNETRMAFAFDTLANDKSFLDKLGEIMEEKNVQTIVIGMTEHQKDEKSSEGKISFAKMVEKETGARIVFQEEMFTTKMAQANIKMRGGRDIAKTDDQESARIILQSWLDNEVN